MFRRLIPVLLVMSVLLVSTSAAAFASNTVNRGYTSAGSHYRKNNASTKLLWSHMHYAVIKTCNYGDEQLATPSQTRSWTSSPSSSPGTHTLSTASGLKTKGTLNAGVHHFNTWGGHDVWSPGGQNGWDKCW